MEALRIIVLAATGVLLAFAAYRVVVGRRHAWLRMKDFWRDPRGTFLRHMEELPFDYPPSVILTADLAMAVAAVTAAVQRTGYFPTTLPIIAVVVVTFAFPILTVF